MPVLRVLDRLVLRHLNAPLPIPPPKTKHAQRGYMMRDRVLRAAEVGVVRAP